MRHPVLLQQLAEVLGLLDTRRADEDWLPVLMSLDDVSEHGVVLGRFGTVDEIGVVNPDHRPIRRDRHDAEVVDLRELRRLSHGGTGHAPEPLVQPEEVLEGDGGEGLVLGLDLHALLRLDGLVQALVVPTPREDAASVLIDDEHLAVDDDVVAILPEELLRPNRIVEEAHERGIHRVVEVVDAELILDLVDRRLEHADGLLLLIDLVVGVALEQGDDARELRVPVRRLISRSADDERGACFIDEN
ncbi:unannotated protein [freshwater metagenome]|uniref:Unannotated protein n=1 Tax=freshwater metagenome TaxID=449393 RepID=A0A6J7R992_9ZZZZ